MNSENLETLSLGSFFLGSGGGLESSGAGLFVLRQLNQRSISILPVTSLADNDCVALFSFLGCAEIETEKNHNFLYFEQLLQRVKGSQTQDITAFASLGAAGGAPFAPIFLSSRFNIPLLDADCAGRCFPQLQMLSTNMADIQPKKAFIANVMGDIIEIQCNNFYNLERHARQAAVSSGGSCLIIPQILTGEEAKRGLIPGTLTKAMTIGQIIQDTRNLDCATACGILSEYTKGTFVGIGGIVSHEGCLNLPRPFKRRIVLKNIEEGRVWEVWMDDEFNLLFENGKIIAEVPDIIALCDMNTREPLTIRQLHVHRNIAICTMKAPDIWYTEKGMALVRTKEHIKGRNDICGLDAYAPTHITKNCA